MRYISSRDNALLKHLQALAKSGRERRKHSQTLLDGAHLITAACNAGFTPDTLVVSESGMAGVEIAKLLERLQGVEQVALPDALFAHASPVDTPSGLLAVMQTPLPEPPARLDGTVLLLERVQDSGNLGTMLRTAAAAGVRCALLTEGCAQAWSPRVLRAGMGAHFALEIFERVEVGEMVSRFRGEVLATALGAESGSLFERDLRGPTMWLFGAEGAGLSEAALALASARVTIPMPGEVESLNVAAAAAICLFEQVRQVAAHDRASISWK